MESQPLPALNRLSRAWRAAPAAAGLMAFFFCLATVSESAALGAVSKKQASRSVTIAQRLRIRLSWNSTATFSKPVLRTLIRLMPSSSRLTPSTSLTSAGTRISSASPSTRITLLAKSRLLRTASR